MFADPKVNPSQRQQTAEAMKRLHPAVTRTEKCSTVETNQLGVVEDHAIVIGGCQGDTVDVRGITFREV